MTKDKVKKILTKLYGPDVQFTKSVSGRQSVSVPLSPEEREIAGEGMSVGRHNPSGGWIEDPVAKQEKLNETRHVVAAMDILTGEWELARDVRGIIQDVAVDIILGEA